MAARGRLRTIGFVVVLSLLPLRALATPGDLPLFPNGEPPSSILHFGLKPDRGLPIAALPLGEGELVVGAPPKAWRVTYVLPKVGLVWSNFFPSWLPTKFYGQWYYVEDWRAMVWGTSELGNYKRIEITNGLEFIECVAHGPMPMGSAYFCPERPELVITHAGAKLVVDYPNGTRNTFLSEDAPGSPTTPGVVQLGRFALIETARKVAPGGLADDAEGYTAVRTYVRQYVSPSGMIVGTYTPELRLGRITTFDSVPGSTGATRPVQHLLLGWRDQNATTRDCSFVPTTEPQCSGGLFCYDGKCGADRGSTQAQQCYSWFCGDFISQAVGAFFSTSSYNATCAAELCNGQSTSSSCWVNLTPCQSPPPMGDPKLYKIVVPQRVDPVNTRPLIYTLHYNVAALSDLGGELAEAQPDRKFLDHIEDNRVKFGAGQNFTPQPPNFGNTIQIGYEKLYADHPLRLKSLSFERGRDRVAFELEFTTWGLMQRIYGDRQTPFAFKYDRTDVEYPTTITIRDPFGLEVEKDYDAIGAVAATTFCDPAVGCDVQLGLVRLETAEGAISTYEYGSSGGALGNLQRVTAVDGSETRYLLDATLGRAETLTKYVAGNECMREEYEYQEPTFPTTPTKSTFFVRGPGSSSADRQVRLEEYDLCTSAKGCPPYEWGKPRETEVEYARGLSVSRKTTHVMGPAGFSSQTVLTDGTTSSQVGNERERDPVFGRPGRIETPGARTTATKTPDPSTPDNPVTASSATPPNTACDANEAYCAGVDKVTTTISTTRADLPGPPDADMVAALAALAVGPANAMGYATSATSHQTGGTPTTAVVGANSVTSGNTTKTYALFTGNLIEEVVSQYGFTRKMRNEWMKVDVPNSAGGWEKREHPDVVLDVKTWAGQGTGLVFTGGTYQCFSEWGGTDCEAPTPDDHTNATHLGPLATGHYRADGSKAPPDWILTEDPREARMPVVGCPSYTRQPTFSGTPCYGSDQCSCGCYCDMSDYDPTYPLPGTCRCPSVLPSASSFICRRTYLLDPKVVMDHNDWWFKDQCSTSSCAEQQSTLYCDNPEEP